MPKELGETLRETQGNVRGNRQTCSKSLKIHSGITIFCEVNVL